MSTDGVGLFVDPPSRHFERDRLFDLAAGAYGGDNLLAPFVLMRQRLAEVNVPVHTADLMRDEGRHVARKIFISLGMRERYLQLRDRNDVVLSAFFAFECPIVEPRLYHTLHRASADFRRMFTYSTEEALSPFLLGPVSFQRFRIPQAFDDVHPSIWGRNGRRFLVMINSNKRPRLYVSELYTERLRALEFFGRYDEIDLFGLGWNLPPVRVGETWVPSAMRRANTRLGRVAYRVIQSRDPLLSAARRVYRGAAPSKAETLGGYTFAICFENMVLPGWITEKIFDCFFAGTIPVYWGAPDVGEWIPEECFIDMTRFRDYVELREFLRSLGPVEIVAYREAARDFVRSARFAPFSKGSFADLVRSLVLSDAGVAA